MVTENNKTILFSTSWFNSSIASLLENKNVECSLNNAEKACIQWQSCLNDVWKESIDVKVVEHFCSYRYVWKALHNTALFLWLFLNKGYWIVADLPCPLCATHTLSLSQSQPIIRFLLCCKLCVNVHLDVLFCIPKWTICIIFKTISQTFLHTPICITSFAPKHCIVLRQVSNRYKLYSISHTQIVKRFFSRETLFRNVSGGLQHFIKQILDTWSVCTSWVHFKPKPAINQLLLFIWRICITKSQLCDSQCLFISGSNYIVLKKSVQFLN